MTNEHEREYAEYLAWERDSLNRLYYALWVVFLGGFLYSLHLPTSQHPRIVLMAVVILRVLAIGGTIMNFVMQYHAIGSLGSARQMLFRKAQADYAGALRQDAAAKRSDRIVARCELPLQLIGAGFLLSALALSFLVYGRF